MWTLNYTQPTGETDKKQLPTAFKVQSLPEFIHNKVNKCKSINNAVSFDTKTTI